MLIWDICFVYFFSIFFLSLSYYLILFTFFRFLSRKNCMRKNVIGCFLVQAMRRCKKKERPKLNVLKFTIFFKDKKDPQTLRVKLETMQSVNWFILAKMLGKKMD